MKDTHRFTQEMADYARSEAGYRSIREGTSHARSEASYRKLMDLHTREEREAMDAEDRKPCTCGDGACESCGR